MSLMKPLGPAANLQGTETQGTCLSSSRKILPVCPVLQVLQHSSHKGKKKQMKEKTCGLKGI